MAHIATSALHSLPNTARRQKREKKPLQWNTMVLCARNGSNRTTDSIALWSVIALS